MVPIDSFCSNATLQPNMYIEKFNISWLSLCITDVAASVKIPDKYVLWGHHDQFTSELLYISVLVLPVLFIRDFLYNSFLSGLSYIIGSNDFRRMESARLPSATTIGLAWDFGHVGWSTPLVGIVRSSAFHRSHIRSAFYLLCTFF